MWGCTRVGIFVCIVMVVGAVDARPAGTGGKAPAAPGAPAGSALDKPAFTATPGELLALGRAVSTGDWPKVVLRDQRDVSYDDRGRATIRRRLVYVVQVAEDLEDEEEDGLRAEWHPSYQDRPWMRARVIAPAGTVAELDPAQISEVQRPPRPNHAVDDVRRPARWSSRRSSSPTASRRSPAASTSRRWGPSRRPRAP
ncbi:MAG: DUF3857 domain-containing protein [Deltaproteobacteria bacterium]|nr:MAG: DUF3857 domain-containing protein [Deltaproteobacteria bacterium]